MSVPSPTLVSLESGDQFLYAEWINNPYIDIYNAYLLVVDTTNYQNIRYVYLTEEEALSQAHKIDGLTNNTKYLIQYTQTQVKADGIQGDSNSLMGTPKATPIAPIILNNETNPIVIVNNGDDTYNVTLPVKMNFNSEPKIIECKVKVVRDDEDNTTVTTQSFALDLTVPSSGVIRNLTLTNLSLGKYAFSCFNVNQNGMGALSNVIELGVTTLPLKVDVFRADSGLNTQTNIQVRTIQTVLSPITNIKLYLQVDGNDEWVLTSTIPSSRFDYLSNNVIEVGENIQGLENGAKYRVKAIAENENGSGNSGDQNTFVPASHSQVKNVTINTMNVVSGDLTANWDSVLGTFGPTRFDYVLKLNNTTIRTGSLLETTLELSGISAVPGDVLKLFVTPLDTVTSEYLAFWVKPVLANTADNWSGDEVSSPDFAIYDVPSAPVSLRVLHIESGFITYAFQMPNQFNEATKPTSATIQLLDSEQNPIDGKINVQDVSGKNTGDSIQQTFSGLENNTNYYVKVFFSNIAGDSTTVSLGPNFPYVPFNGNVFNSWNSTVIGPRKQNGNYDITWSWNLNELPPGYVQGNTSALAYRYDPETDTWGNVGILSAVNNSATFSGGELGKIYQMRLEVYGFIQQPGWYGNNRLAFGTSPDIVISEAPLVIANSVVFGTQSNGNGTITFDVNGNGGKLNGLLSLVVPSDTTGHSQATIFQTQPDYYELPSSSAGLRTYSANLNYKIPDSNVVYLIYAVNDSGNHYVAQGLNTQ